MMNTCKLKRSESKLMLLLLLPALLTACGSLATIEIESDEPVAPVGATETAPLIDKCAEWKAIYIGDEDDLSEDTASQIEAHNLYGENEGCW